jgi:hypothetical protein
LQLVSTGPVPFSIDSTREPTAFRRRKNACAVIYSRGGGFSSTSQDTVLIERVESTLRQEAQLQKELLCQAKQTSPLMVASAPNISILSIQAAPAGWWAAAVPPRMSTTTTGADLAHEGGDTY